MKLEEDTSYKNISQKEWQNKLTSKIKEIEPLLNNNNLEEKQKTLEIQKNNAYFKLEKIGKELQSIEDFLEEENMNNDGNNEDEENLKKKILDIRQKNVTIQGQLNIIKGYYNFVNKYKTKQNLEKKELYNECEKLKKEIQNNKCYTKVSEEEKIILEKRKELDNINQEIEKLLKKIEEKKSQRYIKNIRLKQLKQLINEDNNNSNNNKSKSNKTSKNNNNKSSPKKKKVQIKKYKENGDFGEAFDDIIQSSKINNNTSEKKDNINKETTFDIINRRIPFTISSLDNLISEHNISIINNNNNSNKPKYNKNNNSPKKNNNNKNIRDLIKLEKENINKIITTSENKPKKVSYENNNFNTNNKINTNNNNIGLKNDNKNKNANINMNKKEEIETKENKDIFDQNNPLGWLESDNVKKDNVNIYYNYSNKTNNKEEYRIENKEEDKKDLSMNDNSNLNNNNNINNNVISSNNNNNQNSDLSEVRGLFGNRRRPFAAIKF